MSAFKEFISQHNLLPIIQAPMAGVSTPELAAAVSNAGGLGSIAVGASSVAQAKEMIARTKTLTAKPFNVNVFCHTPAARNEAQESAWLERLAPLFQAFDAPVPHTLQQIYKSFVEDEGAFELLLEEQPAVVSFHFGLPSSTQINQLKARGICTLATATNLAEAQVIQNLGIDAVVAQGIEAGGHRGMFSPEAVDQQLPTSVLVRLLVKQLDIPVIAAGGIMDGQGVGAALQLGAAAAQLGTAFVLCPESAANSGYREALKSQQAGHTKLTAVFSGRPARGIVNELIQYLDQAEDGLIPSYPIAYDAAKQLAAAAAKAGNHNFTAHWAGQGVPLIRELPAQVLINQLISELKASR